MTGKSNSVRSSRYMRSTQQTSSEIFINDPRIASVMSSAQVSWFRTGILMASGLEPSASGVITSCHIWIHFNGNPL